MTKTRERQKKRKKKIIIEEKKRTTREGEKGENRGHPSHNRIDITVA